jgi:Nicotinate phosphoribosyltransferase (NAPRTase) N-terminal domain/ABC transporter substrate binding protein
MLADMKPSALLTDLYQLTMLQACFDQRMEETAVFEFFVRKLPAKRNFLVAAGLEQALTFLETVRFAPEELEWIASHGAFRPNFVRYLENFRFEGDVHAMAERTVFFPNEPILRVTAPIAQAQLVESRVINLLHFETLIASKAARSVLMAPAKLLAVVLLAVAVVAEAQQPTKVPRIGFLGAPPRFRHFGTHRGIPQGLRELGYVEGKNIVIEWQYAEGKADRLPSLAAELVRLKVDLIVTSGAPVTRSTKEATSTIPIVMAQDNDPVGNGFVTSLARPGGNITGLATLGPEISGKQLELLKETVPQALPRGRPRDFDPAGQRTSVKRNRTRRWSVRG